MTNYLRDALKQPTTQGEQIAPGQIQNHDGAWVFALDDFARLNRFLVLGSEGNTFYASEKTLTLENAGCAARAIRQDGPRAVRMITEVSQSGRAPKNDPALFTLALAMTIGDDETRSAAFAALPKVARIGTHLFHWAAFLSAQRGWGKGVRKAVSHWYLGKTDQELALQAIKYPQRDGWSHRDLLRLAHVQAENQGQIKASETRNEILKFMARGWDGVGPDPHPVEALSLIWAAETAKKEISEAELVRLIETYRLPMEAIPSEKQTGAVYEALLPHAGITWLIRNLGNLSKQGVLAAGRYGSLSLVTGRLTDLETLRKGRVHPLSILTALDTYRGGKGMRGSGWWPVMQEIVDALNDAFYLAFDAIEPAGKRYVLAIDVSGSMMAGRIAGMAEITPNVGAAAMAMATKRAEPFCAVMGFADSFRDLGIGRDDRLDTVMQKTRDRSFGSTDCSLPMRWALQNRVEADTFVVYTDNQTNAHGQAQPVIALREYRQKTGIAARLVVVGMVANEFTVADPDDAGMLDVCGFSADAPAAISEFSKEAF